MNKISTLFSAVSKQKCLNMTALKVLNLSDTKDFTNIEIKHSLVVCELESRVQIRFPTCVI